MTENVMVRDYAVNDAGYPVDIEGFLKAAKRALDGIPAPQCIDGAVVWRQSDDVPEDIAVARSYIAAALTATPPPAEAPPVRLITMQDVRLAVGEGKLTAADVLAGCNAELARRARTAESSLTVEHVARLIAEADGVTWTEDAVTYRNAGTDDEGPTAKYYRMARSFLAAMGRAGE